MSPARRDVAAAWDAPATPRPGMRVQDGRMRVLARLSGYWRMEAANVVIVPGCALVIVLSLGGEIAAGLLASLAACAFLLAIGACYWRLWARRRTVQSGVFRRRIRMLAIGGNVSLVMIAGALWQLIRESGDARTSVTSITPMAGWTIWLIAVAEYINYFHVQLQYFDRSDEFRKLRAGGPRRARLARDIDRCRREAVSRDQQGRAGPREVDATDRSGEPRRS